MNNKMSYVSVLSTEAYLIAIKCLYKSLKNTNTKFPFTVLINDNISKKSENQLIDLGINVIRRKSIAIDQSILKSNNENNAKYWNNTFEKLQIFELTEFEKIVYLDADMYVMKNIDELFERDHMSAVIDKRFIPTISKTWIKLNSGLMVIIPKLGTLLEFNEILKNINDKQKACGDQDILQEYVAKWEKCEELQLHDKYNVFFPFLDFYTHCTGLKMDEICVIHFVFDKKPWDSKGDNRIYDYINAVNDNLLETAKSRKLDVLKECIKSGNNDRETILKKYFGIMKYFEENKI